MASLVMTAPDSARFHQYSPPQTMSSNTPDSVNRRASSAAAPPPPLPPTETQPSPSTNSSRDITSRPHSTPAPQASPPRSSNQSSAPQESQRTAQHGQPATAAMSSAPDSPASSRMTNSTTASSAASPPQRIKIKDLQHIQSFCSDANSPMAYLQSPSSAKSAEEEQQAPQYEISNMPVTDVIEMVAGLLTKITTTNDSQAEQLHRNIPTGPEAAAGMSAQTSSVLAFHGKNVPTISIMAYLSRIHKYCPATYEVFLSLLVYFDRITEKVNSNPAQAARRGDAELARKEGGNGSEQQDGKQSTQDAESGSSEKEERRASSGLPSPPLDFDPMNLAHFFVVDSYNIHRLVIAGVTCASKFFSDVFYTNSRYAKVGGLPLVELNHLELQFLILNDFRLSIPVEELEAYATMLVEFYAREVLAQQREERMQGVEETT